MINWNKVIQPLIIAGLVAWLVIQSGGNDTFIEDTQKETQDLRDSLEVARTRLYDEIQKKDAEIDSIETLNNRLDEQVISIDNSVDNLKNRTDDKIRYIDSLDNDGTVVILAGYLSETDGD